jgi:hypothetical protein
MKAVDLSSAPGHLEVSASRRDHTLFSSAREGTDTRGRTLCQLVVILGDVSRAVRAAHEAMSINHAIVADRRSHMVYAIRLIRITYLRARFECIT